MMRVDVGLVLGIAFEYIIFRCYSDALFNIRLIKWQRRLITAAGFLVYLLVCAWGVVPLNIGMSFILNYVLLRLCFRTTGRTAAIHAMLLAALSTLGEFLVMFSGVLGIMPAEAGHMSWYQSFMLTALGKFLYLAGVVALMQMFKHQGGYADVQYMPLVLIPALTLVVLILLEKFFGEHRICVIICLALAAIDIVSLEMCKRLNIQRTENRLLRLKEEKEKQDLVNYERQSILRHDFKAHIDMLSSLIKKDPAKAGEYLDSLRQEQITAEVVNRTDNSVVNAVISAKMQECRRIGVKLDVEPAQASLAFWADIDAAAMFSNILDNAIEACRGSERKYIYMSIYTKNADFAVIRTTNSSDSAPLSDEGILKTTKTGEGHGLGMKSIEIVAGRYNGSVDWDYDENKREFTLTVSAKMAITSRK